MLAGVLTLLMIDAAVFVLQGVLPARHVEGYALDRGGRPLQYRLNGLLVCCLIVAAYCGLAAAGVIAWDHIYIHRWEMLATAFCVGMVFSFAIVLRAPSSGRSFLADFYLGRIENPQWLGGRIDAKLYLYLVGATLLELCLLSFGAHHCLRYAADPSPGVLLYTALFSFFTVDYLYFERVHLYTYDFFAERLGFKLGWGCFVFYPFFYCIGLWFAADRPNPHPHPLLLTAAAVLFFSGWVFARGANMQKFYFKTRPEQRSFGPFPQRVLTAGDKRVLVSGFWGLSRHVNYLGELMMASGLALSLGYPGEIWPWLYPLYYVGLLVPRQIDDDRRCAEKYGALWDEYRRAVPRRIIPFVY